MASSAVEASFTSASFQPWCHISSLFCTWRKNILKTLMFCHGQGNIVPSLVLRGKDLIFFTLIHNNYSHIFCRVEGITGNKTYSFLITLDTDIGDLIMIKFKWEGTPVWENIWDTFQTIIPWRKGTHRPGLLVKSIRMKAGETQQK